MTDTGWLEPLSLARSLAEEFSAYRATGESTEAIKDAQPEESVALAAEFDRRVLDPDLRSATRTRFLTTHYADAVESGVKALCECIRSLSGSSEDGDKLMTSVFSPNNPLLRINDGRTQNDQTEQRGHMFLCQGVVAAWRNPRAHSLIDDSPARALMMLEHIDDLIATTRRATREQEDGSP